MRGAREEETFMFHHVEACIPVIWKLQNRQENAQDWRAETGDRTHCSSQVCVLDVAARLLSPIYHWI